MYMWFFTVIQIPWIKPDNAFTSDWKAVFPLIKEWH